MECLDTVVSPLVSEEYILEPFPNPPAITLAPRRNVNVLDLIDPDQSCTKVVKAETTFDEIGPLFHILNPQGYPEPPKASLQLPHPPFRRLAIRKYCP